MYKESSRSSGAEQLTAPSSKEYSTTDLNLASFLACRGLEPLRREPPPPNTFPKFSAFVFSRDTALEETISEWTSDKTALVDVHDFVDRRRGFWQWVRAVGRGGAR